MNTANIELCRELYEVSRWGRMDNSSSTDNYYTAGWVTIKKGEPDIMRKWDIQEWGAFQEAARLHHRLNKGSAVPAYDLGYLLRKLPDGIKLEHYGDGDDWEVTVFYEYVPSLDENVWANADTPEDAATKLCISLFQQGILTKEQS